MHPHDDEDVLEVRADGLWSEGVRTRLLEHDGHDVIPDVALPQQLIIAKKKPNVRDVHDKAESYQAYGKYYLASRFYQ